MLCLHDNGGILTGQEQTGVVDGSDEVEILLLQSGDGTGTDNTGIGHHHVQTAELLNSLSHQIGNALFVGNVHSDGASPLAHLGSHGLSQRLVHISDDDGSTFLVQLLSNALAEALCSAGDDGDLASQTALACGTVVDVLLCQLHPFGHIYSHGYISLFQEF